MDAQKTKVAKSKSSNSTSETKKNTQKNNKKSRSNAEFQANTIYNQSIQPMLKRRGVYVEKKAAKTSITRKRSPDVLSNKPQPCPPRSIPRASREQFLASVLTILSKSTAGTQCPDGIKSKSKLKRRDEVTHEVSVTTPCISKRKRRCRSRVLKNHADNEVEPVVVLQSTKDIAQTPSNNSECITDKNAVSTYINPETLRWAESLPPLDQENLNTTALVASNSKKVDHEPANMIADAPKRIDKHFYNFFVDVLKTSFSVYNVKTKFNKELPPSSNSSKIALEMNESLAGKLNTMKNFKETSELSQKPSSKRFYSIQPDERQDWDDKQLLKHFQPEFTKQYNVESPKRRRKFKSESFNYNNTKPLPNTTSLLMPKRKTQKNSRKKEFIKSLKEQLRMKEGAYNEPENFYQALKVLAKNKRRCQQSTDVRSWKRPSEGDVHVCQLKRRKVLSAKSSWKQSNDYPEIRLNPLTLNPYFKTRYKKGKLIAEIENEIDESKHSLEVVGYDYETKSSSEFRAPSPTPLIEDSGLRFLMD